MIDPREFAMLDQGATQYLASLQKPQQKKAPKKKNFLLDQISTLGGIAGGIGGSFIAPIAGTAGGAAAGSGLGEAIENIIMGDSVGKNVGKEALLGGVFAAPPTRAAKAVIGAGKAAKTAKATSNRAAKAIEGEVVEPSLKTSASGRLNDLANKSLTSQYGTISRPVARATRPEDTFGELASYGVTKPSDVENIASNITGADGLVTKAVSGAIGKAGRVNTDGLKQILDDALENAGVVDKDAKEVRALFNAQMKKLQGGPKGSLKPDADPTDVIEVMRNIEARIAEKSGRGSNYRLATDVTRNQARALSLVRDELEDRLYQGAGANKNLAKVLTPEFREGLIRLKPGDAAWQNYVDTKVMGAKDVGQLRSAVAPFVRARQIIDEADVNSMTFGGRGGNLFQNGLGGAMAALATNVFKNPAARATASTLKTVSGNTPTLPANLARPSAGGIASRLGTVGAITGGINQITTPQTSSASSLEDALMQQLDDNAPSAPGSQMDVNMSQMSNSDKSPFAPQNLETAIQQIVENGGTIDDVSKFVNLASAVQKIQSVAQEGGSKLSAKQQEAVTRSANAASVLDDLEDAFAAAGGGQGRLGGTIANFAGRAGFNDEADFYNQKREAAVSILARALGEVGTLTDQDIQRALGNVPKIEDNPEVATQKIESLRRLLKVVQQNTVNTSDYR